MALGCWCVHLWDLLLLPCLLCGVLHCHCLCLGCLALPLVRGALLVAVGVWGLVVRGCALVVRGLWGCVVAVGVVAVGVVVLCVQLLCGLVFLCHLSVGLLEGPLNRLDNSVLPLIRYQLLAMAEPL